jgi:hypothetical protein
MTNSACSFACFWRHALLALPNTELIDAPFYHHKKTRTQTMKLHCPAFETKDHQDILKKESGLYLALTRVQ